MKNTENTKNKKNLTLKELINRSYQKDPLPIHILQLLANRANYSKNLIIADCAIANSRLHYEDRLYVPDYHALRLHLCYLHHNSAYVGHLEIDNSYKQLYWNYY